MAHHAYFVAGERSKAVTAARAFAEHSFLRGEGAPDIAYLNFELFSVEDSRRLIDTANLSGVHGQKVIIVSMTRFFHEAQNALLKILEEPPEGLVIILCVPSEGIFIPTLRSRLLQLPYATSIEGTSGTAAESITERFFAASSAEREKLVAKLVEQSKADKDETKQQARREALELLQGLTETAYAQLHEGKAAQAREEARLLLTDLSAFMPILYERSAPLKLIFEHLLLVIPKSLRQTKV